jgi:hypothetical protein
MLLVVSAAVLSLRTNAFRKYASKPLRWSCPEEPVSHQTQDEGTRLCLPISLPRSQLAAATVTGTSMASE